MLYRICQQCRLCAVTVLMSDTAHERRSMIAMVAVMANSITILCKADTSCHMGCNLQDKPVS